MTTKEIYALPDAELFQRVAEMLWPWDESRCRVCGWPLNTDSCTKDNCLMRYRGQLAVKHTDDPPDLDNWNGVGMMLDEIGKRIECFVTLETMKLTLVDWLATIDPTSSRKRQGRGNRPAVAVARAVLLALNPQPEE